MTNKRTRYLDAIRHFQYARWQATFEQILARLRGESNSLLSYEEVRAMLHAEETPRRQLREIPLAAIVGSVGRYNDFTRTFLPLRDSDQERWARVQVQMSGLVGLPPIEAYQIGDVYFVQDGNHRVSVARMLEATAIEAYVTEVETRVPLGPADSPDDLILKAELADFLNRTRLDELRPAADLRITTPGRYRLLLEQIDRQRLRLIEQQDRDITKPEAAAAWFDQVYTPIAQLIETQGLLRDFPGRTPLDLYAWLLTHRQRLRQMLGWDVAADVAIADIAAQHSPRPGRVASRLGRRLVDALTPEPLEKGPAPGLWREARWEEGSAHRSLFRDILVPISGHEEHWFALSQALLVAQREGGRILGLHVLPDGKEENAQTQAMRQEFYARVAASGTPAHFTVVAGVVHRAICDHARWTDLTVVRLIHPTAPKPAARAGHGLRAILRRCAGPLLIAQQRHSPLQRPLLAYHGTAKADEALFVAAYLAGKWQLPLTVLVVQEGEEAAATLAQAQRYLDRQQIAVTYLLEQGEVVETLLHVAAAQDSDLLIVGGYDTPPLVEIMIGSTLEGLLRQSTLPLLVCR
ncbi:MAG: universal stress protein [Caldilineales bacterium]|nr:universal stress protein [Caldilineales bacterium]